MQTYPMLECYIQKLQGLHQHKNLWGFLSNFPDRTFFKSCWLPGSYFWNFYYKPWTEETQTQHSLNKRSHTHPNTTHSNDNTLWLGQNGHHSDRQHFQIHFLVLKVLYFDLNFTDICSQSAISNNPPALVHIMALLQTADDPLPQPMLTQVYRAISFQQTTMS